MQLPTGGVFEGLLLSVSDVEPWAPKPKPLGTWPVLRVLRHLSLGLCHFGVVGVRDAAGSAAPLMPSLCVRTA